MGEDDSDRLLGVGVLGAAAIAKKVVRGIKVSTAPLEVVAVGSRDIAKAEAFVQEAGIANGAKPYGSYQEVLDDDRVDIIYMPLPSTMHLEWVKKAAALKKHVVCEKPLAGASKEADEMIAACQKAGVQFMDGTMWMHNPRTAAMMAKLQDENVMGDLRTIITAFSAMGNEEFFTNDIRVQPDLDPLGALGDLGWYCVRAILWAFDFAPPRSVTAHPGSVRNKEGVLMHVGATILFDGHRRAVMNCGFDEALNQIVQVSGTKGLLRIHDFVIPREEDSAEFRVVLNPDFADGDTAVVGPTDKHSVKLDRPQESYMWEAFARCVEQIRDGRPPAPSWPAMAALTQRVVSAIEESDRAGCKSIQLR